MKVLVTGGAGMVGSHVAEYYAKRGDEVVVLDNLMRSKLFGFDRESVEYNWRWLQQYPNVRRVLGDVRVDKDVVSALGDGVDAVIHAAGQPGVPLSVRIPKEDFSINAYGTLNMLEHTRQICPDAAFVYCSTNKVYGENVDRITLNELDNRYTYFRSAGVAEDMPIDQTGHTPYGASKYVGDIYVQEYAKIYGMKTAVFRMSCIYGTRQFGFEDQGWVAWFIFAMLASGRINIYGDGKQVRDMLYVDDVVQAYDAFIQSDIQAGVWNIGGGMNNTTSLVEFIAFLESELGQTAELTFCPWRPSDQKVYITDVAKVSKDLSWSPRIQPHEGYRRLIAWARRHLDE